MDLAYLWLHMQTNLLFKYVSDVGFLLCAREFKDHLFLVLFNRHLYLYLMCELTNRQGIKSILRKHLCATAAHLLIPIHSLQCVFKLTSNLT